MYHVLRHVGSHSCHIDLEQVFRYADVIHPVLDMSALACSAQGYVGSHGIHRDELTGHTPGNKNKMKAHSGY